MSNTNPVEEQLSIEDTELDIHDEAQVKAMLRELQDDELTDDEREEQEQARIEARETRKQIEAAVKAQAIDAVKFGESLIQEFVHPDLMIPDDKAERLAVSALPLLAKYGGNPPSWLTQYKEEIMFAFAVGGVGLSLHSQYKGIKKREAKEAEDAADKREQQA
ncbi:hypothetical protein [Vibrio sp. CyArs1]|uniref:hypothetical protein n=1 Tax=Vibrio sp. CyArs1 TaxID=2682577 RepID=UPI001F060324|nr:hypothetical protein [Vibrio sp. CyArs1]